MTRARPSSLLDGAALARPRSRERLVVALPFLLSFACIVALYRDDLDTRIVARFFDRATQDFRARHDGTTLSLVHRLVTDLVFLTAVSTLGRALWLRARRGLPLRRSCAFLVFASIACGAALVALLKAISPDPSPWDATDFGGPIHHGWLFQSTAPPGHTGHGSPGAHASGVFALMSSYFCLRERRPRLALAALLGAYVAGHLAGFVQVMRGAHYPSHNAWSAIIVWGVILGLRSALYRSPTEKPTAVD